MFLKKGWDFLFQSSMYFVNIYPKKSVKMGHTCISDDAKWMKMTFGHLNDTAFPEEYAPLAGDL